jgi:phosphoenolpyruvate synthase/pyruvate phosphate dikinase
MKNWKHIASDYNSPFWRNYIWTTAIASQPKFFGIPQCNLAIKSDPQKMTYLYIPKTWKEVFKYLSKKVDADIDFLENVLDQTVAKGQEMNQYTEKFVKDDLSKYSVEDIISSYKKHADLNIYMYALGVLVPFLDFQEFHYIEDKLREILKNKLNPERADEAFSVFTQPTEDSFATEQEKSILNIYSQIKNKEILNKSAEEILSELKLTQPEVYQSLQEHAQKYAWVYYVYSGPAYTIENFIELLKFYFKKGIGPEKKLANLQKERTDLIKKREQYFNLLDLNDNQRKLIELAAKFVWAKPRRKDYQSKSYWHLEFLQREIGRRLGWSLAQVRSATPEEIEAGLNDKKVDIDLINERLNFHIVIPEGKKVKILQGKEAEKWQAKNLEEKKEVIENLNEISGQSAFPGKVSGKVCRVDLPDDMPKMKEGDILVSTATTPSIVPAIRKAAAIVADEGGLTCHAAIVSREFKIPCVVGTKIGTQILRDGDQIEVDAIKGVIKKL